MLEKNENKVTLRGEETTLRLIEGTEIVSVSAWDILKYILLWHNDFVAVKQGFLVQVTVWDSLDTMQYGRLF